MLQNFILITLFLFFSSCSIVNAEPTQLVPCNELFKVSPIHEKYFTYLSSHYGTEGDFKKLKPIFTMYIIPAFEPESVIVVYGAENKFFIERFSSTKSVWYSLSEQSHERFQGLQYAPPGSKFNLPAITNSDRKKISQGAAKQVEQATLTAIANSRLVPSEFKDSPTYLDGTSFYFVSSDNKCARPFGYSETGVIKDMYIFADVLVDFLSNATYEKSIISATEKVLNNYK